MRDKRNWEAEFKEIKYSQALEIAKDENIKEVSISKNIGNSKENFSKSEYESGLGSVIRVNLTAFDKNSIKNNHIKLKEGRFPKEPYEIVISDGTLVNEEIVVSKNIELTINEEKNTYKIVGIAETLPNSVSGFVSEWIIGAMAYYDESTFEEDTRVNITVLSKNIKDIYKTTQNLSDKLKLYETEEEKAKNMTYYSTLLNYALVNFEDKTQNKIQYIGEAVSEEFEADSKKIVTSAILVIRACINNCYIYCI